MRPVGLAVTDVARPLGLVVLTGIVMLLGTNWYTRLLVTGKPFV